MLLFLAVAGTGVALPYFSVFSSFALTRRRRASTFGRQPFPFLLPNTNDQSIPFYTHRVTLVPLSPFFVIRFIVHCLSLVPSTLGHPFPTERRQINTKETGEIICRAIAFGPFESSRRWNTRIHRKIVSRQFRLSSAWWCFRRLLRGGS